MEITEPWTHPATPSRSLSLVQVPAAVLHALARGDRTTATRLSETPLSAYVLGAECHDVWSVRSEQIVRTPQDHPWVTRLMLNQRENVVGGVAGFHGAPDERGMVEIGYRVEPAHRRRGHARAALEIMLDVARAAPDVAVVRATVRPDNAPSRALIAQYGFREVGEQWDDEDGLETIFEIDA